MRNGTETVRRGGQQIEKRIPLRVQVRAAELLRAGIVKTWDAALLKAWLQDRKS